MQKVGRVCASIVTDDEGSASSGVSGRKSKGVVCRKMCAALLLAARSLPVSHTMIEKSMWYNLKDLEEKGERLMVGRRAHIDFMTGHGGTTVTQNFIDTLR